MAGERRGLLVSRVWVQATILVVVCGFFILGLLAYRTYMAHPPVPKLVVDSQGRVLYTGRDIQKGQQVFLHNGLMEYGSAFGHGAYLGPDFTADYLRRSADLVRRSYGRVPGADARVHAAGDAAAYPIKHGGLGAQMADTAAASIAQLAGAQVDFKPFLPVIRAKLLSGGAPLYLSARLVGRRGFESEVYDSPPWPEDQKVVAEDSAPTSPRSTSDYGALRGVSCSGLSECACGGQRTMLSLSVKKAERGCGLSATPVSANASLRGSGTESARDTEPQP